jgi:hypothetical protein
MNPYDNVYHATITMILCYAMTLSSLKSWINEEIVEIYVLDFLLLMI